MHNKPLFLIGILIATLQLCPQMASAQQAGSIGLRSDNIDQVLKAMTTEEKCSLLVGDAAIGAAVPNVAIIRKPIGWKTMHGSANVRYAKSTSKTSR